MLTARSAGAANRRHMSSKSESTYVLELLDTDNYKTWSTRMRLALIKSTVWHVVKDGFKSDDPQAVKDNDKAYAMIGLHVKDFHLNTVAATESAKELWDTFGVHFMSKNNAKKLMLRRDLTSLKKQADEPLTKYVARGKSIWSDLVATGYECRESEVTLSVLAGLPAEYEMVVTVLTTTSDDLSLDEIVAKLLPVEQRLSQQRETVSAYSARGDQRQHKPYGQNQRAQQIRKPPVRYYCNKTGHFKAQCRVRIEDEKKRRNTVAFMATTGEPAVNGEWIMDSGASSHLSYDKGSMSNFRALESRTTVTFANGQQAKATGIGTVLLNTKVSGYTGTVQLLNVLYVPEARANLFSIKQAANSGASITFQQDKCVVTKDGITWVEGFSMNGVYILRQEQQFAMAATSRQTPELWHRRLGHLGYDNLYKLRSKDMVQGLHISAADIKAQQNSLCEPCVMSKQHRLPFPDSERKSSRAVELIHMDVCGPLQEPSHAGAVYIATFLDDYSKLSVVRAVALKSDIPATVKEVLRMLETQAGQKLKLVRTDRGSEYLNAPLMDFFQSKGIIHETTALYTPQQNGAAERLNRTLMERVRAMLHGSKLSVDMWAEAAVTANFIRNRSPVSGSAKTPWELFYNSKPDISHMRVFGSKAYVHIPKQFRRKLDPLSKPGIFIGYEANSKAYRILLDDGKITVSRDVMFDEAQMHSTADPAPSTTLLIQEESESDLSDEGSDTGSDTSSETSQSSPAPSEAATIPSEAAATGSPTAESSSEAQPRYPGRQRQKPKEWYKASAMAAQCTQLEEPQTYEEAIRSPNAKQ